MGASEIPAPLQAIVRTIAALQDADADAADAALARPVSAFAALLPERAASVLAGHGHEILEIDPPQAKGLPVGLAEEIPARALLDLSMEIRPALTAGRAIRRLAAWPVEQFPREAREVPAFRT